MREKINKFPKCVIKSLIKEYKYDKKNIPICNIK